MENLTVEQVKRFHNKLINKSGGRAGIWNEGLIDSAINRGISTFDGAYLYTSDIAKISAITHSLISNHGFLTFD